MKVKVSELTGAALDYAVAVAVGVPVVKNPYNKGLNVNTGLWAKVSEVGYQAVGGGYSPSTKWEQCGPLIDAHGLDLMKNGAGFAAWMFNNEDDIEPAIGSEGETYLIAACRVIVASKLGDEVDVPDALVEVQHGN